ncbi:hypothetical protein HNQ50_003554 [Silvimonas terrae]|uniref:Uncharacterized protein n=1 Tax=Silvimonas terrae TaxID=300266 RepID=A0A840RJZ3_9NEIS|nr:hypothetical protein [Silvimonas terrae]MBB5192800.1 hypothetical protein [Silvimonas terrae]
MSNITNAALEVQNPQEIIDQAISRAGAVAMLAAFGFVTVEKYEEASAFLKTHPEVTFDNDDFAATLRWLEDYQYTDAATVAQHKQQLLDLCNEPTHEHVMFLNVYRSIDPELFDQKLKEIHCLDIVNTFEVAGFFESDIKENILHKLKNDDFSCLRNTEERCHYFLEWLIENQYTSVEKKERIIAELLKKQPQDVEQFEVYISMLVNMRSIDRERCNFRIQTLLAQRYLHLLVDNNILHQALDDASFSRLVENGPRLLPADLSVNIMGRLSGNTDLQPLLAWLFAEGMAEPVQVEDAICKLLENDEAPIEVLMELKSLDRKKFETRIKYVAIRGLLLLLNVYKYIPDENLDTAILAMERYGPTLEFGDVDISEIIDWLLNENLTTSAHIEYATNILLKDDKTNSNQQILLLSQLKSINPALFESRITELQKKEIKKLNLKLALQILVVVLFALWLFF